MFMNRYTTCDIVCCTVCYMQGNYSRSFFLPHLRFFRIELSCPRLGILLVHLRYFF
jgi:hypothetical protein